MKSLLSWLGALLYFSSTFPSLTELQHQQSDSPHLQDILRHFWSPNRRKPNVRLPNGAHLENKMLWVISISQQWNKWAFPFLGEVGSKQTPLLYFTAYRKSEWLMARVGKCTFSFYFQCKWLATSPLRFLFLALICSMYASEREKEQPLLDCSPSQI